MLTVQTDTRPVSQGYTYAVFNLIYENNVASCRLWDALGFKRIGRVPGAGRLRSSPDQFVDAIIYGRDLGPEGEDSVTQDRFDKIRYYLRPSTYPRGADRAEKSRLRSAATHYKLTGGEDGEPERLMLKDKEVVSDPEQQYEIAKYFHFKQHAGINKTTAAVAIKYHWVRIKETVNRVIRDCPKCKETMKASAVLVNGIVQSDDKLVHDDANLSPPDDTTTLDTADELMHRHHHHHQHHHHHHDDAIGMHEHAVDHSHNPFVPSTAAAVHESVDSIGDYTTIPLDPQIIDINQHLQRFQHHDAMTDPYNHDPHDLPSANFDVDVRHHAAAANDYQMMVDDSDTETGAALRREALGLVTSQAADVQQEHEILAKYVARSEDDLDFS